MRKMYLQNAFAISPQTNLHELSLLEATRVNAQNYNYKELIPPMALRRMSTAVKMGLACGLNVLKQANIEYPDAIITSTGMGCLEDTEKFLSALLEQKEELLSPTSFIQSTHNTVGAQIALNLKCTNYNNTLSQAGISFETAIIDAELFLLENPDAEILVGGVDELGSELIPLMQMMELNAQDGIKVPFSEGAAFFLVNCNNSLGSINIAVETLAFIPLNGIQKACEDFINSNQITLDSIDLILLGSNGDGFDIYYAELLKAFPEKTPNIEYKKYFGEHFSSSSLAIYLGFQILKDQINPVNFMGDSFSGKTINKVLIYHQFKGKDHGFTLLSR